MFLIWGVGGLLIFARSAAARLTAACLRHIDVEWNCEKGVPGRCCSWLRLPLLLLLPLLLQCHMMLRVLAPIGDGCCRRICAAAAAARASSRLQGQAAAVSSSNFEAKILGQFLPEVSDPRVEITKGRSLAKVTHSSYYPFFKKTFSALILLC